MSFPVLFNGHFAYQWLYQRSLPLWGTRVVQRWEHSPPTIVARVQILASTPYHIWVEFVVGSLPFSERFFSGYSGFPLFLKTNTFHKFQFDLERTDKFQRAPNCSVGKQITNYNFAILISFLKRSPKFSVRPLDTKNASFAAYAAVT